jgi:hypothetical protein
VFYGCKQSILILKFKYRNNRKAVFSLSVSVSASVKGSDTVARLLGEAFFYLGVVVVVGAGNHASDPCDIQTGMIPQRMSLAITVGASTRADDNKPALFTNYGPCIDVYAPGRGIRSAGILTKWDTSEDILKKNRGRSKLSLMDGTSQVLALVLALALALVLVLVLVLVMVLVLVLMMVLVLVIVLVLGYLFWCWYLCWYWCWC